VVKKVDWEAPCDGKMTGEDKPARAVVARIAARIAAPLSFIKRRRTRADKACGPSALASMTMFEPHALARCVPAFGAP
jgi:hypothetical protein